MAKANKKAKPAPKAVKKAPSKAQNAKKPAPAKSKGKADVKKSNSAKAVKKVAPKPVAKPLAKKQVATPVKAKVKPAAKPVVKPVSKTVSKAAAKPAAKPTAKTVVQPASKTANNKAAAKPVVKVVSKATAKPTAKPVASPAPKIDTTRRAPEIPPIVKKAPPSGLPKATAKNVRDIKVAAAKPVSIPKISTKTSRQYQPDFTKSVLDQPKIDLGASIVRYSDAELREFRELIQRKLEAAKKELTYLQGLITRKDEMGGDESENRYLTMEDGSLSMEREQLSQMASRQITYIDHLEKALMRIENQTYGICRVTGKLIDKARLRAVPHATLSIEAKMGIVK